MSVPYDSEVEYVRTNYGLCRLDYIPTGYNISADIKIQINGFVDNNSQYLVFGSYTSTANVVYYFRKRYANSSSDISFDWNTKPWQHSKYISNGIGSILNITCENQTVTINGTSYTFTKVTGDTNTSRFIFGSSKCDVNVYKCKLWNNGVLIVDIIPVRVGTIGYLYDKVSGKLFGNAGSGDFILGNDIVDTIASGES